MVDTSVKLRTIEGGVPKERDPVVIMGGVIPQVPIVVGGTLTTLPQALSDRPTQAEVEAYVAAAGIAASYDMGTLDETADGSGLLDFGVL